MSQRSYRILDGARRDFEDHAAFILNKTSEEAARKFLRNLFRTARLLSTMPFIGRQVESDDTLREFGIRGARGIRLVYRPLPDTIEIVRVVGRNQHWIP